LTKSLAPPEGTLCAWHDEQTYPYTQMEIIMHQRQKKTAPL